MYLEWLAIRSKQLYKLSNLATKNYPAIYLHHTFLYSKDITAIALIDLLPELITILVSSYRGALYEIYPKKTFLLKKKVSPRRCNLPNS